MLIYHRITDIVAKSDFMRKGYKVWKQLNIMEAASALDKPVRELLPFLHAFGGCDTTSSIHDKGKSSVVKIIHKNESLQEKARTFMKTKLSNPGCSTAGPVESFEMQLQSNWEKSLWDIVVFMQAEWHELCVILWKLYGIKLTKCTPRANK